MRASNLLLLFAFPLFAQDPVHWTLTFDRGVALATAQIDSTWHIYSVTQGPGGPFPTRFTLPEGQPFRLAGAVAGPTPKSEMDPNFGIRTETHEGLAAFRLPIAATAEIAGGQELRLNVRYQACDESNCLPPRTDHLSTTVSGPLQAPATSDPAYSSFVWLAMTMGALSLLTPCVFPMVPITVSYFTSHAAASRAHAVRDAGIYAFGIVLTFTALGLALAAVFGAAGINKFAANPWVNLAITGIFVAFALSLFGAFHLGIPSSVLTRLDSLSRNSGSGSVASLLLMGLTFSLTSFTCTAPFVGTLLVMAAEGRRAQPLVGMLAFSTVFAAPFFLLALAPQLLSRLPKAGGWMNSVKVMMGLLEIAAAMKFLSNADLIWSWGVFTREVVLAIWIVLGLLIVLYALGLLRTALDSPVRRVGAGRLVTAALFLAITIALVPGIFGHRLGELESFLPPATGETADDGLHWIVNDLAAAEAQARRDNKLVFVDFTGYTCTNCRWMEANMFPRPEVHGEMAKYVAARLYTDGEGPVFERQQKMQQNLFHTVALPLYAILQPDGTPVATFPGLTRDAAEFVRFLKR